MRRKEGEEEKEGKEGKKGKERKEGKEGKRDEPQGGVARGKDEIEKEMAI